MNLVSVLSCLGVLLTYAAGAFLHWRTLNWALSGPPVVTGEERHRSCVATVGTLGFHAFTGVAMFLFLVETPTSLVSRDRRDEATAVLQALRYCTVQ